MSLYYWPVVISVTYLILVGGINRIMDHYDKLERVTLGARLEEGMGRVQPRRPFAGAQDPAYELSPFPGEGVVTHNELDQYARHYQGIVR